MPDCPSAVHPFWGLKNRLPDLHTRRCCSCSRRSKSQSLPIPRYCNRTAGGLSLSKSGPNTCRPTCAQIMNNETSACCHRSDSYHSVLFAVFDASVTKVRCGPHLDLVGACLHISDNDVWVHLAAKDICIFGHLRVTTWLSLIHI